MFHLLICASALFWPAHVCVNFVLIKTGLGAN